MSLDSPDQAPPLPDDELRESLIIYCRLSPEDIGRTMDEMGRTQAGFCDAALKLGVVTENEVAAAREWAQQLTSRRTANQLVTTGRGRAGGGEVVFRHASEVTPGSQLILAHDPDHPRSERIRALRTELLLAKDSARRGQVIAVLSPGAGEGRSQLAAELAIAFSQLGRRTLLIDADLRRPSQHLLFGADNVLGLTQSLAHGDPPQMFGVTGLPNLSLLTSGSPAPNPLELISDARFLRMIREWRRDYAFVIIDTPPVTQYSDGLAIAKLAAGVLVVSRGNVTAHSEMKEMLRRLESARASILGAVINHF